MADYWISQERKYCDFCKCWITNNRPSVDFHEKGKKHQENVKKRLNQIQKQSRHDNKLQTQFSDAIHRMETAALAAYDKDMANNPDLTSLEILKRDSSSIATGSSSLNTSGSSSVGPPSVTFRGHLALLKAQEDERTMEEKAKLAREKMRERRIPKEDIGKLEELNSGKGKPIIEPGKSDPYGRWETIKTVSDNDELGQNHVDLQLPQVENRYVDCPPIDLTPECETIEFREKTIKTSLESNDNCAIMFKKRKLSKEVKRNARTRSSPDE